jgi:hypothetical protein
LTPIPRRSRRPGRKTRIYDPRQSDFDR